MILYLVALLGIPFAALAAGLIPPGYQFTVERSVVGEPRIGTYVSNHRGFKTASYWIEGPDGLVMIDTQFLLSAAQESLDWAEKATGKKVVLAVVLHPNPDKFNGVGVYRKRGIRVVTSEAVRAAIPAVHELRKTWFYERFKPDYPETATLPEGLPGKTQEISAAGLKLKLHFLGKGCSAAHVVVEYQGHLFTGDLVTNDFHSWLELGQTPEWLERIDELQSLEAEAVHPGRGPSGDSGLLDQQEHYLRTVQKLVSAEKKKRKGKYSDETQEAVMLGIETAFPGYQYPLFVENGLKALWENPRL